MKPRLEADSRTIVAPARELSLVALGFCDVLSRMPAPLSIRRLLEEVGPVDKVGLEARAAAFTTRSIKKAAKLWGLKTAVTMVDLTTLEGQDTPGKVAQLCAKALQPHAPNREVPSVAAVCVYPALVATAKRCVAGSKVRVASVATAFPSGQAPLRTRLAEVRAAVEDGADEIDMVLNRNAYLSGRLAEVRDEVAAVLEACAEHARLKVILETSELDGYDQIRAASFLAMRAGLRPGDFIKTSTGKTSQNATLANTQVMLEAIRDHYLDTGIPIGMKPAGGIRTAKQALQFLVAVKETLGDDWLTNTRYRFGASALLNDLLRQIEKERLGAYQPSYAFSDSTGGY